MSIFSFVGDVVSLAGNVISGDIDDAIADAKDLVTKDVDPALIAEKQRLTALYGSTGGTKDKPQGTDYSQSPGLAAPTPVLSNPLDAESAERTRTMMLGAVALFLGLVFVFSGKRN